MATAVPWVKRILWIIFLGSQQLVIGMDDPPDSVNPISGYTSHDPVTENSKESLQLTCSVTGVPNPNTLTYTWSSDCGTGGGVNSTLIPASTTTAMAPNISHISTIRLVNGGSPYEGRVEVYYSGSWGTICDDEWNDDAAGVVCRMLGYRAGTAVCCATFGPGLGSIWLDDVTCFGNETDIADCRHGNWSQHNCAHSEDAGVRCIGTFQISIPRSRTMNNKQCYCTVTHSETGWTQTSQPVTFNITYPPYSLDGISGYSSLAPINESSTEALHLTCSANSVPNPNTLIYAWSSGCGNGVGSTSQISVPRNRTMNNKQCYCTVTHVETGWNQTTQPVTFNIICIT